MESQKPSFLRVAPEAVDIPVRSLLGRWHEWDERFNVTSAASRITHYGGDPLMLTIQERHSKSFYALLSLPSTAMGFALSIQISALSWILTTRYKLDIHQVGLVWAAGPLAGIFGQVIVGMISDTVWLGGGRRRPFIVAGGILASLMLLALPNIDVIARALGIGNLLIVATIVALSLDLAINISFNPTRSIIADVTPEGNERTKGYTWMQTISGFFGVLAYVIGATLGNYVLIYSGAILVLLFSVLPPFLIKEPRTLANAAAAADAGAPRSTDWGQLWRVYLAHGFSWVGVQTMFVFIIAFIQQKMFVAGVSREAMNSESGPIIAIAFAVLNTVGFVLPAFVLEPLSEKVGRVRVHGMACALMAAAYIAIALKVTSPAGLYLCMAVAGVGWASIVSIPFAIMSELVDQRRMGLFMGIFNLSVVLPQLLVSLFVGSIIQNAADKSVTFMISAVTLAASAGLWMMVRDRGAARPPAAA
jgi:MFS family permease